MNRKKEIEQLFRQHYAKLYNLARCILSDDDESKDVVSEVFAQILADDVVLVPGSEDGYLMRSVRNGCLNLIAHKGPGEAQRDEFQKARPPLGRERLSSRLWTLPSLSGDSSSLPQEVAEVGGKAR